jgi:hypothetical protein
MAIDSLNAEPDAYIITVDGEVLTEAGKHGVIKHHDVADQIRNALVAQCPEKSIELFGFFLMRQRNRTSEDHGV